MQDLAGAVVEVSLDICKTPYHSFVLLWVPPPRRPFRLSQPRAVTIAKLSQQHDA